MIGANLITWNKDIEVKGYTPIALIEMNDLIKKNGASVTRNHTEGGGWKKIKKKGNAVLGCVAVACHNVPIEGPCGLIFLD